MADETKKDLTTDNAENAESTANIADQAAEEETAVEKSPAQQDDKSTDSEQSEVFDAIDSFLSLDNATVIQEKKRGKLSKTAKWIILGVAAAVVAVGVLLLLIFLPSSPEEGETDLGTDMTVSVDDNGEHQANVVLDENGKIANNSFGTLIDYTPAQISQIDVENESGTYTVTSYTPTTTATQADSESPTETSEATVYTLVGYEDFELQSGIADAIANDAAKMDFTSVASASGDDSADFGFDSPRATVKVTYTDGTKSVFMVGAEAPSSLGAYVMFGSEKTVYLATSDAVDGFLYSVLDLISLTINDAATDTDNGEFSKLTISGSNYDKDIVIKPNTDNTISSTYVMTSPYEMFVNETEGSAIAGDIRGLYADKVVCVSPSSAQLKKYGLSSPYAGINASYPDTTVKLICSKPQGDNVYLMESGGKIIYQLAKSSVGWVNTSVSALSSELVLGVNLPYVTELIISTPDKTYDFDVKVTTETVTNDDGEEEQQQELAIKHDGDKIDSTNFKVLFQNLSSMQNIGKTDKSAGSSPVLSITYSYSSDRSSDTIKLYDIGTSKYLATLNGKTIGLVHKSYATGISDGAKDLVSGKTVKSL